MNIFYKEAKSEKKVFFGRDEALGEVIFFLQIDNESKSKNKIWRRGGAAGGEGGK